jgi:hypothetical protein
MTTDDEAASAFHRLERAMDTANHLIGELIHKLDDTGRPRLRVVNGSLGPADPRGDEIAAPRLRIVRTQADG